MAPTMGINEAVVLEVRDLINAKGSSISWLSRETGVKRGTLVNYVTRMRSPMPVDVMDKVAGAFGLTLVELADRAEDRRGGSRVQDDPEGLDD